MTELTDASNVSATRRYVWWTALRRCMKAGALYISQLKKASRYDVKSAF